MIHSQDYWLVQKTIMHSESESCPLYATIEGVLYSAAQDEKGGCDTRVRSANICLRVDKGVFIGMGADR